MKNLYLIATLFLLIPVITFAQRNPASTVARREKDSTNSKAFTADLPKSLTQNTLFTSAVQSSTPGITDHTDVQVLPSSNIQAEVHISINRQNPNILVASANTLVNSNVIKDDM